MEDLLAAVEAYLSWDGVSLCSDQVRFVWVSHMLLPKKYASFITTRTRPISLGQTLVANNPQTSHNITEKDAPLIKELAIMTSNHLDFCKRITPVLSAVKTNSNNIQTLFREFNLFLNLGFYWDGSNFCPSLFIDFIWHAAMTDPINYKVLCTTILGETLDHCLQMNEGKQEERDKIFYNQFLHQHSRAPYTILRNLEKPENGIAILSEFYHAENIRLTTEKKSKDEADAAKTLKMKQEIEREREAARLLRIEEEKAASIEREVSIKLAIEQATNNKNEYAEMIKDNPELVSEWQKTQMRGDYYLFRNYDNKLEVRFHEPIVYRGCKC
jgi:hypothetical protein